MNWKNRLTNYNFWISMFSAVLLILQALKIEFDIAYVNEIFTAVLGLLVVIGIISDPTRTTVKSTDNTISSSTKVETTVSEEIEEQAKTGETIPIDQADETDDVNTQNDIQAILTKITTSIDEKMKELAQFNLETLNKLNQNNNIHEEEKPMSSSTEETQSIAPTAVAEMSNPFVDVIN